MSIFLSILKVIGIILLILFAVVLGLFLLVLFFPVTYKIQGKIADENHIGGKVSWLFSLISIRVEIRNKDIRVWLRIAGIKKNILPKEEKKTNSKVKVKDEPIENQEEELVIQATQLDKEAFHSKEESIPKPKRKRRKKSLQKYLPWNIIKEWIAKIKKIIFSIKKNFSNIKKSFLDETNKNAVKKLWRELKFLLRHIGLRRGQVNLKYCTGDPSLTGKITGGLSIMPFMYKKGISVIPDFVTEHPYVKGTFRIKGHLQMFHFIGTAIRVYKDKDIKKLISKFK